MGLELGDALAYGAMGDAQFCCRARVATDPSGNLKDAQRFKRWKPEHPWLLKSLTVAVK
jgi:hypothetical protein